MILVIQKFVVPLCAYTERIFAGISRIKQNLLRDYSLGIFKLYNDNI